MYTTDNGKIDTEEHTRQLDDEKSILAICGSWTSREILRQIEGDHPIYGAPVAAGKENSQETRKQQWKTSCQWY
jgi:hypothetical protein